MNNSSSPSLSSVYAQLTSFANLENFWSLFNTAFGSNYDFATAAMFKSQWQSGDFSQFPVIEMVGSDVLGRANGAYAISTNKIYLSDQFVSAVSRPSLVAVILEEYGHFVDAQINTVDSAGDEGNIFARLVQGETLSAGTLAELKAEDKFDSNRQHDLNNMLMLLATSANSHESSSTFLGLSSNLGNKQSIDIPQRLRQESFIEVKATQVNPFPNQNLMNGNVINSQASKVTGIGEVNKGEAIADTVISRTIVEVSKNPQTNGDESQVKDNLTVVFAETLKFNPDSGRDVLDIYQVVDTALRSAYQSLSKFRFDPEYTQKLETAFGQSYNSEVADRLFDKFAEGTFTDIPILKIVNRVAIAGGNGAFSAQTQKVYLAVEFIEQHVNNTPKIADVLIEEIGHFIDSQINEVDAPGDEGDIFSELVQGNSLTEEELRFLKEENDKATVYENDKISSIEQNSTTLRVATWNIWRDDAKATNTKVAIKLHKDRLSYISGISSDNNIDVVVIQEFNWTKFSDEQELRNIINSNYDFRYLPKEYIQNSQDNWYKTLGNPNSSGYLILYNKNNITISGSFDFFSSSDPIDQIDPSTHRTTYTWQSEWWNKFYRTPIKVTVTKGSQAYDILTWHNETNKKKVATPSDVQGGLLRPDQDSSSYKNPAKNTLSILNEELNLSSSNPTILLGDLNVTDRQFQTALTQTQKYRKGINTRCATKTKWTQEN